MSIEEEWQRFIKPYAKVNGGELNPEAYKTTKRIFLCGVLAALLQTSCFKDSLFSECDAELKELIGGNGCDKKQAH
jgi:hypothetical protein